MLPSISVVIPTLNEEKNMGRLLERLRDLDDIEIIVSDGGSTDETRAICEVYSVRIVTGTKGRGNQLNAGASVARGSVLLFIHADSVFEKDLFHEVKKSVTEGAKWGCCKIAFDEPSLFFKQLTILSRLRASWFSTCYGDQGIYCRTDFFKALGGFPNLPIMEDVAFSDRAKAYVRAKVVPATITTSARRFTKNGPLRTIIKMQCFKALYRLGFKVQWISQLYEKGR